MDSVFTNTMNSPESLQIIFNCLRNVEENVNEIYEMQEKTQGSQIKGELQLSELNEAIDFTTKNCDQYEAERTEKEKIINDLQGRVSEMSNELQLLKDSLDRQHRHSQNIRAKR